MLDELSHITRFVLQTKTELFDNVWTPRYFCIITTEHHTTAETKFEQIAQNRNIDEQLFALASHDFSQNTDIQDRDFQDLAAPFISKFQLQILVISVQMKQFYFNGNFIFKLQTFHTYSNTNSQTQISGVDQNLKCSKWCGNFQNITISKF
ncbi:Hypothetical_protein [Hexamita inflata]|uniref:Hypothetical_protein n=1 Tax=Hexamita inflata TaxID=28002 RepID=A0AA86PG31_9EUKA|nr:Hypothetical protein HINF_LOCUS26375 [Hexamita inflata]